MEIEKHEGGGATVTVRGREKQTLFLLAVLSASEPGHADYKQAREASRHLRPDVTLELDDDALYRVGRWIASHRGPVGVEQGMALLNARSTVTSS